MSYAGLGQQHSAVSEPPKDPIVTTTPVVPMTPTLYTLQQQAARQNASPLPRLAPAPQAPSSVSDWRRQLARMIEALGVMLMTLPGDILTRLRELLAGLSPSTQQEAEDFSRAVTNPTKTDAEVAAKLKTVTDRYRELRPTMPAPAVRMFDPIVDGAINLVPQDVRPAGLSPSPLAPSVLDSVPWLWAAGSFVAGMFACAFITPKKTTPNRRVRRRRRR